MAETPDAMTARSGEGQAFSRALRAQPPEIRKMYADLYSIEVKEAFRKTWSKNRTFDFVEKERVTIHGKTQLETEAGEWMTFTQLRTKLGAPDPQGEKDAEHYKHMRETEELKDQLVKANKMLGCDVYLYIAEVKQCTNVKEVKDIVGVLTKDAMSNTWMDQVQKDRAFRAWASEKKVRMDSIKLEDIRGSKVGRPSTRKCQLPAAQLQTQRHPRIQRVWELSEAFIPSKVCVQLIMVYLAKGAWMLSMRPRPVARDLAQSGPIAEQVNGNKLQIFVLTSYIIS